MRRNEIVYVAVRFDGDLCNNDDGMCAGDQPDMWCSIFSKPLLETGYTTMADGEPTSTPKRCGACLSRWPNED